MKTYFENKKEMKTFADLEKWKESISGRCTLSERKQTLRAEGPSGHVETRLTEAVPVGWSTVAAGQQLLRVCRPNPHLPSSSAPRSPTQASFSCEFF